MTQATQNHITSEHEAAIEKVANDICRRGFRVPALAILESGPLIPFLGSQLLLVAQPALSLFTPSHNVRRAAELLESPATLTILTECLRAGDNTRDS